MLRLFLCTTMLSGPAFATTPLIDPFFGQSHNGVAGEVIGTDVSADTPTASLLQSDGKVVIAGTASINSATHTVVTRLNRDGSVDMTFGDSNSGFSDLGTAFEINSLSETAGGALYFAGADSTQSNAYVGRLTSTGQLDTTFHINGYREIPASVFDASFTGASLTQAFVLPDGGLLAIGHATQSAIVEGVAVQLTSDGAIDSSFNHGAGSTAFAPPFTGSPLFLVTAAQRLTSGSTLLGGFGYHTGGDSYDIVLAQLTASGDLDASFGYDGFATFGFDVGGSMQDISTALAVDANGNILVGAQYDDGSATFPAAVLRFNANGQLDTSFGTNGYTKLALPVAQYPSWIWPKSDGSILVAMNPQTTLTLTSLDENGSIMTSFATAGEYIAPQPASLKIELPPVGVAMPILTGDWLYAFGQSTVVGMAAMRLVLPIFNNGFE